MCSPSNFDLNSEVFEMEGDSLKAGRLLSLIRRRFQVRMPIATLFHNSKVCQIRNFVDEAQVTTRKPYDDEGEITASSLGCKEMFSSTYFPLLLLQLVPLVLLYPMKQALRWTFFLYILAYLNLLWSSQTLIMERYITLLASIFFQKSYCESAHLLSASFSNGWSLDDLRRDFTLCGVLIILDGGSWRKV